METNEQKPFYKSLGVLGSSGVIVSAGAKLMGFEIGPDDWNQAVEIFTHGQATVADLLELGAGAVALWGRIRAKQGLSFTPAATLRPR
jgi:hypothetical protein